MRVGDPVTGTAAPDSGSTILELQAVFFDAQPTWWALERALGAPITARAAVEDRLRRRDR